MQQRPRGTDPWNWVVVSQYLGLRTCIAQFATQPQAKQHAQKEFAKRDVESTQIFAPV